MQKHVVYTSVGYVEFLGEAMDRQDDEWLLFKTDKQETLQFRKKELVYIGPLHLTHYWNDPRYMGG
ncbi:hypothetical protein DRO91_08780 [Candidatus Heimdallarchaeota archaeon]|nr:MAG: hypothetical protein DRO91_08780 [Candidatus Heimdallarchaeota archaeon]